MTHDARAAVVEAIRDGLPIDDEHLDELLAEQADDTARKALVMGHARLWAADQRTGSSGVRAPIRDERGVMDWYRRYRGTCRDEKLEMAAKKADLPRPYAIAAWDAVLEFACGHEDRGRIDGIDSCRVSVMIGCTDEQAGALLDAFTALGMIDGGVVVRWKDRQFQADNSYERVKRYREKQRNEVKRFSNVSETAGNGQKQSQRQIQNQDGAASPRRPSADDDTKAATDPLGYSFRRLVELGVPRSLVAKWKAKLRDPTAELIEIVAALEEAAPDDAKSWFVAACQARTAKPRYGIPETSIFQF